MKVLQGILILLLLGVTIPAHANAQEVQADLLLAKISAALQDNRMSEALSACVALEKLGPSLAKPLPESFYFYYIETLHQIGAKEGVVRRAYAYLQKYGKDGAHFDQVTTIVSELQRTAGQAGTIDADAAVIDWKEASSRQHQKEHEQTLQKLRVCQSEAIALEGTEKELSVAFTEINAQSDALLTRKEALDQRASRINRTDRGAPEEQAQMRVDFNRDSQAYNDAVRDFNNARESYEVGVAEQSRRFQRYEESCANLSIIKYDLEEVCGKSMDWFCRNIE